MQGGRWYPFPAGRDGVPTLLSPLQHHPCLWSRSRDPLRPQELLQHKKSHSVLWEQVEGEGEAAGATRAAGAEPCKGLLQPAN